MADIHFGKYKSPDLKYAGDGIFLEHDADKKYFPSGLSCFMTIINYLDKAIEKSDDLNISFLGNTYSAEVSLHDFIGSTIVYPRSRKEFNKNMKRQKIEKISLEYSTLSDSTEKAIENWLSPDDSQGTFFKRRLSQIKEYYHQ